MGRRTTNSPEPVFTLQFEHHMAEGARQWWRRAMLRRDFANAQAARKRLIWIKALISFLEAAWASRVPDSMRMVGRRCAINDDTWPCRFIYFQVSTEDGTVRYLLRDLRHPDEYVFANVEDLMDISDRRWANVR